MKREGRRESGEVRKRRKERGGNYLLEGSLRGGELADTYCNCPSYTAFHQKKDHHRVPRSRLLIHLIPPLSTTGNSLPKPA